MIATAVQDNGSASAFEITETEFRRIAAAVHRKAGILLPETKKPLVYSRLARRLRALGLDGFGQYCDLIESEAGREEQEELILAITTNVTAFFRERHHFDILRDRVLPDLIAKAKAGGRVRIWSAACSSGEEPYSIALTVLGALPGAGSLDFKILATDIDRKVLAHASAGFYPDGAVSAIPKTLLKAHTEPAADGRIRVGDAARSLITFKQLNLLDPWPMKGPFDVIFCRNVVIYFDRATQETLWGRFSSVMAPGGYIMIGHSERISGSAADRMKPTGITTYQKPPV